MKFSHLFTSMKPRENGAFWIPPSWRSSTIVLTWRCFSRGTSALIVSASSRKLRPATPVGVTISGVPWSVSPTKAIFSPSDVLTIRYAGSSGLSVSVSVTFAARYWKTEPANGVPSWQPSTGWQPSGRNGVYAVPVFAPPPSCVRFPYCIRSSSSLPSSNSWFPTPIVSRPT